MNSRLTILVLTALIALGVVVPAIGQTTTVAPKVKPDLSARALAKARLALLTARSAKSQSRVAARTAQAAVNTATDAKTAAAATQAALDSTKVQSGSAAGAIGTESKSYVQLAGGPSVTVDVPSSGLIEVWAQATFAGEGAIALFEDGQLMPGQSQFCAPNEEGRALIAVLETAEPLEENTVATPGAIGFGGFGGPLICGTFGPPSSVLFQTTPGKHTYELRYQLAECPCSPGVTFSKRSLRVAPRL
jgi:hypothetical protein